MPQAHNGFNTGIDGTSMMAWVKVAEKGAADEGLEVEAGGRRIALFRTDKLYALEAGCAHQDQSIACGMVKDGVVECPHHFWHYDIKTGKLLDYLEGVSLCTFGVDERDDGVYVDV